MRSERLLSTLLLLQAKRRRSARELSTELGVSVRTVYRDVDALCGAGVPIYTERGPQGGIVLSDEYRRALAQFTPDEIGALFAGAAGPLADLGMHGSRRALDKIAGAMPEAQRRTAEAVRDRLLLDNNRWYRGVQPADVLAVFRSAIGDDRRVRFTYRDRAGSITERVADPLGLVAKAGVWYVVARTSDGLRTFRAERIADASALDERFARPADFSLGEYWQSSTASLEQRPQEPYDVRLRAPVEALERLSMWSDLDLERSDGAHAIVRLRFPSRALAAAAIVAFDLDLKILEPGDLIDTLVATAKRALARFGPGGPTSLRAATRG